MVCLSSSPGRGEPLQPRSLTDCTLTLPGSYFEIATAAGIEFYDGIGPTLDGCLRYGITDVIQVRFPAVFSFELMPLNTVTDTVISTGLDGIAVASTLEEGTLVWRGAFSFRRGFEYLSIFFDASTDLVLESLGKDSAEGVFRLSCSMVISPAEWLSFGFGLAGAAATTRMADVENPFSRSEPVQYKAIIGSVRLTPGGPTPLLAFHISRSLDLIVLFRWWIDAQDAKTNGVEALAGLGWRL